MAIENYINKIDRVFKSCKTAEQVEVAKTYAALLSGRILNCPRIQGNEVIKVSLFARLLVINIDKQAGLAIKRIQEKEKIVNICRNWSVI